MFVSSLALPDRSILWPNLLKARAKLTSLADLKKSTHRCSEIDEPFEVTNLRYEGVTLLAAAHCNCSAEDDLSSRLLKITYCYHIMQQYLVMCNENFSKIQNRNRFRKLLQKIIEQHQIEIIIRMKP
jgi:hypothetical protein